MIDDIFYDVLCPYIEKKAKSFMEQNEMEYDYDFDSFMKEAMDKGLCPCSRINSFLNEIASRVAKKTGRDINDVCDDIRKHYNS